MIKNISRDILYYRHQLSHQQIDDLLGECESRNYPETKAQHLGIVAEFDALVEIFADEGISFIPLKGPVLSYRLYKDPLYRSYNDLDFLVKKDDIQKIIKLLSEKGYTTPIFDFPEDKRRQGFLFNYTNEIYLYNSKSDTSVELHWKLFKYHLINQESLNELINDNLTDLEFHGNTLKVLNNEFDLIYCIIHGGLHGWSKLKWLVDIKEYICRTDLNKDRFLFLVKALDAGKMVSVCNELLKFYFPAAPLLPSQKHAPVRLVRYCRNAITAESYHKGSVKDYFAAFKYHLQAFPGFRFKLSSIRYWLFDYDLVRLKRIPCSLWVYYAISPFSKLCKRLRRRS